MKIKHKKKWKTNRCLTFHFVMHVCPHPFVHLTSPEVLSIAATHDKTIIERLLFVNVFVFTYLSHYLTKPGFPLVYAATLCQSSDRETAWGNC